MPSGHGVFRRDRRGRRCCSFSSCLQHGWTKIGERAPMLWAHRRRDGRGPHRDEGLVDTSRQQPCRVGAPGHRRSAGRRALRNGRRQATPEVIASSIQLVAAQPQKVRVQADPSEAALIPLRPNDDSRTISLSDGVQQLVLNVGIRSRPRGDRSDQQRLVAQEARTGARFRPLPLPDVHVCSAESGRGEIA